MLVQLSVSPGKITFGAVQASFTEELAFKLTGST